MPEPALSVIIPTHDRWEQLAAMLDSLDRVTAEPRTIEVIVVDDGSTDGTAEKLAGRRGPFPLRVVSNERSQGPALARNRGANEARGTVLGFLDSDVIVQPDWWQAARPHFSDPGVGGVEGATLLPPGSGRATLFTNLVFNDRGGSFQTCNMLYRRTAFLAAGGFDERFCSLTQRGRVLHHREDTDLAFAILETGQRIIFEPRAIVWHPMHAAQSDYLQVETRVGIFEPLLRRKHPLLYAARLKWIDGRAFPVVYWGYYLGLPLAAAAWAAGSAVGLVAGLVAAGLGWLGAVAIRCHKRRAHFGEFLWLCLQLAYMPWLRLYWVLRGEWIFRRIKPHVTAS